MKAPRLGLIALVVASLLLNSGPAAAQSRDIDTWQLAFLPCFASAPEVGTPPAPGTRANDGAFAHICFVRFLFPATTSWQASTGEWILFDARLAQFADQAACEQFLAQAAVTIEFQRSSVPFDTLSCQPAPAGAPPGAGWVSAYRYLSHPLPPGVYTASLTITPPGGTSTTFMQTVTVLPQR